MADRIKSQHWQFRYDPANVRQPLKEKVLDWFERRTSIRIGEYKNYTLL